MRSTNQITLEHLRRRWRAGGRIRPAQDTRKDGTWKSWAQLETERQKNTKSPGSREVCSTDHFLTEVKVPHPAPRGPPRHPFLSLHLRFCQATKKQRCRGCLLTHTHTHRSPFLCSNRPRAGITQAWQTLTEADLGWNSRRGSVYPTACPFPLYIKPLQISQRVHHSAIGYEVTWKHMHLSWRWKGMFESGKSWF